MSNRRSRAGLTISIGCLVILCIVICLLFGGYLEMTRRVEAAFGPASPALNPFQRVRLSAQLFLQQDQLQQAADPRGDSGTFEIPLGQSPLVVAAQLQASGLIQDTAAFVNYLTYTGLDTSLQAGEFTLSPASTPIVRARSRVRTGVAGTEKR